MKRASVLLFCLVMVVVTIAPNVMSAEKVTLRLNYVAAGLHAPFYMALKKGYYAKQNLNVDIVEGTGSATTVKLIGNRSDTFGFTDSGTAIVAITQGMPVRIISPIYQINAFAVVTLAENKIDSPKDLEGKRLGITQGDALSQLFPAFVVANGLNEKKINYISMDANAKSMALMNGQIDAILGGEDDQAVLLRQKGLNVKVLRFSDYGVPTIGLSLIANDETIKKNPGQVRRFLAATLQGWNEARKNMKSAIAIEKQYIPTLEESSALEGLKVAVSCLFSKNSNELGKATEADWVNTVDLMVKYRGLDSKFKPSDFYTDETLPSKLPNK